MWPGLSLFSVHLYTNALMTVVGEDQLVLVRSCCHHLSVSCTLVAIVKYSSLPLPLRANNAINSIIVVSRDVHHGDVDG